MLVGFFVELIMLSGLNTDKFLELVEKLCDKASKDDEQRNFNYIVEEVGEYAKELAEDNQERKKQELSDLILASLITYKVFYGDEIDLIRPARKWLKE